VRALDAVRRGRDTWQPVRDGRAEHHLAVVRERFGLGHGGRRLGERERREAGVQHQPDHGADLPRRHQRPVVQTCVDEGRVGRVAQVVGAHPGPRRRHHQRGAGRRALHLAADHDRPVIGDQQLRVADRVQRGDAEPPRHGAAQVVGLQGPVGDAHQQITRDLGDVGLVDIGLLHVRAGRAAGVGVERVGGGRGGVDATQHRQCFGVDRRPPAPRRHDVEAVLDVPVPQPLARPAAVEARRKSVRRTVALAGLGNGEAGDEPDRHREQGTDARERPTHHGRSGHGHLTAALASGFLRLGRCRT
jgi:hypothetical protein